jgi:hypothetical protein
LRANRWRSSSELAPIASAAREQTRRLRQVLIDSHKYDEAVALVCASLRSTKPLGPRHRRGDG